MSLVPPTAVGKLQAALHAKAKRSPDDRFYALYDKVYREDVLCHAHRICQLNGGARAWTDRRLRTLRSTGRNSGWGNWRNAR